MVVPTLPSSFTHITELSSYRLQRADGDNDCPGTPADQCCCEGGKVPKQISDLFFPLGCNVKLLQFQTLLSFSKELCAMSKSETEAWEEQRTEMSAPNHCCLSVIASELLSQLDYSNSAFFLVKNSLWLFSCSLNYSISLQGRTSVGRSLPTVAALCGEQVQKSGLVTPITTTR